MEKFIKIYENNLSSDFCEKVIKKFELDQNKINGKVAGGYNPNMKQSTDLNISFFDYWKEEDDYFFNALKNPINSYLDELYFNYSLSDIPLGCIENPFDYGYQIQKTTPDQIGYKWHHDFTVGNADKLFARIITYIWYLNDIDEGGETEFVNGTLIKPKQGNLILFPATWTFGHRGHPPKNKNKYICTGWYHSYF